eukprot:119913_1
MSSNVIKILYVHGLESGPVGTKTIALNKNSRFHVDADDMYMSQYDWRKKNSMIRNVFRQQTVPVIGCTIAMLAAMKGIYPRFIIPGVGLYCGAMYYYRDYMYMDALKASLEQCIDIQVNALNKYKPDLIIGSSWGGNVTTELLKRNLWNGPTILLCPAYYAYQKYINFNENIESLDAFNARALKLGLTNKKKHLIVHGDIDEVVSVDHSKLLYEFNPNNFDLIIVPNDNHRLTGLTTSDELCHVVNNYMS